MIELALYALGVLLQAALIVFKLLLFAVLLGLAIGVLAAAALAVFIEENKPEDWS